MDFEVFVFIEVNIKISYVFLGIMEFFLKILFISERGEYFEFNFSFIIYFFV